MVSANIEGSARNKCQIREYVTSVLIRSGSCQNALNTLTVLLFALTRELFHVWGLRWCNFFLLRKPGFSISRAPRALRARVRCKRAVRTQYAEAWFLQKDTEQMRHRQSAFEPARALRSFQGSNFDHSRRAKWFPEGGPNILLVEKVV